MKRAGLLALFLALASQVTPSSANDGSAGDPRRFVQDYVQGGLHIRGDANLTPEQKDQRAKALLHDCYDIATVPQALLGQYWNKANATQQSRYLAVFEDYLVVNYGAKFDDVADQLSFTGTSAEAGRVVVHSLDMHKPSEPTRIDWTLTQPDGQHWRISDVVVDGTSSVELMRQDFLGVLRGNRGDVDALVSALERQTAMQRQAFAGR